MQTQILIIDDDNEFINDITILLKKNYECIYADNANDGLKLIAEKSPDVVLLDLMLDGGISGIDILKKIKKEDENIPVILITDYSSVDTAVEAIKLGAVDYISKSPNLEELSLIIKRSLKEKQLGYHTETLLQQSERRFRIIVGESKVVNKLKEQIKLFAKNENTILITGESGVGKELVARHIHKSSNRAKQPFIAINCAAIPRDLIESELFGHEKGAFTGADKKKPGKLEIANNGTIFLDEISELDFDAQVKLLRVLQEKEFERVGSTKTIQVNIRIIAATNRDLSRLVSEKLFRDDLFYRLDVLPIEVPPLRNRIDDIPALTNYFLEQSCAEMKIKNNGISNDAILLLQKYDWPGNIRELQNNLIRALILANGKQINTEHINRKLIPSSTNEDFQLEKIPTTLDELNQVRKQVVNEASRNVEKIFLENLLTKYDGNISKAAEAAGINRSNLHKMMKKCDITKNDI